MRKQHTCPCGLEKTTTNPYIHRSGAKNPKILIVGEAPGQNEELTGELFSGKSGKLLRNVLKDLDVNLKDVCFTNAIHCRPPKNVTPTNLQIASCSENLLQVIRDTANSVKLVLLLGNIPLMALLNKKGITKYHGIAHTIGDVLYVPCYHPSYVLRDKKNRFPVFAEDIANALDRMDNIGVALYKHKIIDAEQLEKLYPEIVSSELVALDYETTGKDPYSENAAILGLGICWKHNEGVFLPLEHKDIELGYTKYIHRINLIKKIMENNVSKVFQNGAFDVIYQHMCLDIPVSSVKGYRHDTILQHHLLDENDRKHALSQMTSKYLPDISGYDNEMKAQRVEHNDKFAEIPLDKIAYYCVGDVVATWRLCKLFRKQLQQQDIYDLYKDIVMPVNLEYIQMSVSGVKIDIKVAEELKVAYAERDAEIHKEFKKLLVLRDWPDWYKKYKKKEIQKQLEKWQVYELTNWSDMPKLWKKNKEDKPLLEKDDFEKLVKKQLKELNKNIKKLEKENFEFNPASATQCVALAYKKLKLPLQKAEKFPHNLTLGKEALETLLEMKDSMFKENYAFLDVLKRFRQINKLMTTYTSKYQEWIKDDGLVHPQIKMFVPVTGRISTSKPNMTNIPKKSASDEWLRENSIKKMFVSKFPDGKIIGADYSQLELRLMAALSQDKVMLHTYKTGGDLHETAGRLLHPDYDAVSPEIRDEYRYEGKQGNFKGAYSMSRDFLNMYPGLGEWVNQVKNRVLTMGYACSTFRRRRRLPTVYSKNKDVKTKALRQGVNSEVQGPAHDIMKRTVKRVNDVYRKIGLKSHAIIDIHDALYTDTYPGEEEKVYEVLKREMRDTSEYPWLNIPLCIEIVIGDSLDGGETVFEG